MIISLYILLLCYLPILDDLLPKTNFGEGIPDIGPYRAGTYLLVLVFMIHWAIKKDIIILNNWLKILGIFYIIVLFSISWSDFSYSPFILKGIFDTVFVPFVLAVIALNLFEHPENIKSFSVHITIAAILLSILSFSQMVSEVLKGKEVIRASGTFGNPNSLAIFLVLSIPYILYAKEKGYIPIGIGMFASIMVITGVVCTVSRKGIVTMIICFLVYNYLKKNYRIVMAIFIGFIILTIAISGLSVITRRFEKEELMSHWTTKALMVGAGLKMYKTSPIIGLGYKGYFENFGKFYPDPPWPKEEAHNIYVTALANYGTVGIIPFLGIFFYPLIRSLKTLRGKNKLTQGDLKIDTAIICISSLIPFMISGWFAGGLFYSPTKICLLYTTIALFLSQNHSNVSYKDA
ncbi:MAG: O-antigen ligase family protein [Deltaproteobacteria bacterium]|nr:O-antigen ligase family protein [Deltaproteobacteria bacterium]